ncbi:MAG: hypothetical protein CM15mP116_08300 [Synechococcus sp.]|nr:MAG: hypothetical protein CM15mP116_08300 [Synechococcus sp.]
MELVFSQILDGLSIGSVLLLAATGLAIVFGLMGVINLAHGEFMMLGAYVTFVVQNMFRPLGASVFELYYLVALVASFVVTALVGVLLERTLIRRLYGRPLETLLATWGVSLILIQFVRSVSLAMVLGIGVTALLGWLAKRFMPSSLKEASFPAISVVLSGLWPVCLGFFNQYFRFLWPLLFKPWFGPRNIDVTAPKWLQGSWGSIGGIELPGIRIFIIVLSALLLAAVAWFLTKSVWGFGYAR